MHGKHDPAEGELGKWLVRPVHILKLHY